MSSSSSSEWEEVEDAASRRMLFYNKSTGVTTFEKPEELKNTDERKRVRKPFDVSRKQVNIFTFLLL